MITTLIYTPTAGLRKMLNPSCLSPLLEEGCAGMCDSCAVLVLESERFLFEMLAPCAPA